MTLYYRDESAASQLLSLDVGGTVYTATKQTFAAVPDSWFAKILSGDVQLPRNAQDIRFVDRDSQVRSSAGRYRLLQSFVTNATMHDADIACILRLNDDIEERLV
jgi:BTB/POZ domain